MDPSSRTNLLRLKYFLNEIIIFIKKKLFFGNIREEKEPARVGSMLLYTRQFNSFQASPSLNKRGEGFRAFGTWEPTRMGPLSFYFIIKVGVNKYSVRSLFFFID